MALPTAHALAVEVNSAGVTQVSEDETDVNTNEVATTCLVRPATFPDMTARLRIDTPPHAWQQLAYSD